MTIELDPEMEAIIQKQMDSGAFASPEQVIQYALAYLNAEEDWLIGDHREIAARIQEGWDQAQKGELLDEEEVRTKMQIHKQNWVKQQRTA